MQSSFVFCVAILTSCLCQAQSESEAGEACLGVSNVEIRYKDYFSFYLGFNHTTKTIVKDGLFYNYINEAVNACCNFMDVNFTYINTSTSNIEELALNRLSDDDRIAPRPFVFYFPEFATSREKDVYDFELPFVKLSRSAGQAAVMLEPGSKRKLGLFYIVVESGPMLVMMLAMSWFIGILGWITDHWKNPEEFPSPFIFGMFEGFWWAVVTMTTVGYGDKAPKSVPARILAVVWVLISAVFLSLFTANATNILNQSIKEEDYTKTIGKKIGVFQSKEFDEFQLNMGAEVISFDNHQDMENALNEGKIDRFLFPDYKDLLWLLNGPFKHVKTHRIAKVFESPFQVGMVLSMVPEFLNFNDTMFLKCLRSRITYGNRWWKNKLGYGKIVYPKQDEPDVTTALNQESLYTSTYYLLAAIACLAICGIAWDVWKYHLKRKTGDNSEDDVDVEPGKVNSSMTLENTENEADGPVKDDATWF